MSRGLGDVYKRQAWAFPFSDSSVTVGSAFVFSEDEASELFVSAGAEDVSLTVTLHPDNRDALITAVRIIAIVFFIIISSSKWFSKTKNAPITAML